jgi:hypothetical protein
VTGDVVYPSTKTQCQNQGVIVIPVHLFSMKCPGCDRDFGAGISQVFDIKIKTGLGPEKARCAKCEQVLNTGLLEWQHMSKRQKVRYAILSVFNSVVGSFLPGMSIYFFGARFFGLPVNGNWNFQVMLFSILPFALLLLCLQVLRVELSNRRVDEPNRELSKSSNWSWLFNYQMMVIVAGLILFVLSLLINLIP